MTGWTIKTEFVTLTPLEYGNWSSIQFETAEECQKWWDAKDTRSHVVKVMTMVSPDGTVVASRTVT